MTGSGLWAFIVELVGLVIIGAIIFAALDYMDVDGRFKNIAKLAIGGVLVLALLAAIGGVLGFGGGGAIITPGALIQFAITVIVLLVVWWIICSWVLPWIASWFPPLAGLMEGIKFIVSAIMLIVLLYAAAALLFGGQLGISSPFQFGEHQRHSSLSGYERSTARLMPAVPSYAPEPSARIAA